jgi:hypothetical protein
LVAAPVRIIKVLKEFGGISPTELDDAFREAANHRKITKVIDGHLPDGTDMHDEEFDLFAPPRRSRTC